MLDRLLALEFVGIKLGLENIHRLCDALGHPERRFRAVHIAGTNGKGSVTAMIHAALLAAGVRSARYTSPHLSDLRERFVIGDQPVSSAALNEVGDEVLRCADDLVRRGALPAPPTFFEATTAIAFELFRRAAVDVAVVEVGLGGRFDATNVLSAEVGAITSIGFDHEKYLGNSLAAIAFEKAGIIKTGMTVVTGALPEDAVAVITRCAAERGARLIPGLSGTRVDATFDAGAARITVHTPDGRYGPVTLALRGVHQVGNAVVAIRVLEALAAAGIAVGAHDIERGLSDAQWPGRLELVAVDARRRVLIDAAHNPDGAAALAGYLAQWHPERPPLVIGLMSDKDAVGILRPLLAVTSTVVTTAAATPRARAPHELADQVRALDPDRTVLVETSPAAALDRAWALGPVVCVAGSIFLAGAIRDVLKERAILP